MNTTMHTAPEPMTRFNLYILSADLRNQLEKLSADTGRPIGTVLVRAVPIAVFT